MTISTRNGLIDALANNSSFLAIEKASISNQTAARPASLWRATGVPGQAAIPSTPALCTKALLGSLDFTNQTAPATSYLAWAALSTTITLQVVEIHDRLAHNGGLVLNSTSLQSITGLDLSTLSAPLARLGAADYSDVQWWLEVYADGGATASSATIGVTYNDGTTGNLNVQSVGGTIRAANMFPLTPLIPTGSQGKYIRGVTGVTLSASTGTAGSFGFTATRPRAAVPLTVASQTEVVDWARLGLPDIPNDACLSLITITSATTTGAIRGFAKIAHG